jgi:hypothetical protein
MSCGFRKVVSYERDGLPNKFAFYSFSSGKIVSLLNKLGYRGEWTVDVERSSSGDSLRVYMNMTDSMIELSCDGTITEKTLQGKRCWINNRIVNDELEVVAWEEDDGFHFYSGEVVDDKSIIYRNADYSAQFFYRKFPPGGRICALDQGKTSQTECEYSVANSSITQIFRVDRPNIPVWQVESISKQRIFVIDDLVIFTFWRGGQTHTIQKLKFKNEGIMELVEEIQVSVPENINPRFFGVMDASPWSSDIVFYQHRDLPFWSREYLFDMDKEGSGMEFIQYTHGWGFFLKCDIWKEVLKGRV